MKKFIIITFLISIGFTMNLNAQSNEEVYANFKLLIGKWKIEADMSATRFNPSGKFTGVNTVEWGPGEKFILIRSEGKDTNGPVSELEIIGYDQQKKIYLYSAFNSQGWSNRSTTGIFKDNVWIWTNEINNENRVMQLHNELKMHSVDKFSFENKISINGGEWQTVITGVGNRIE